MLRAEPPNTASLRIRSCINSPLSYTQGGCSIKLEAKSLRQIFQERGAEIAARGFRWLQRNGNKKKGAYKASDISKKERRLQSFERMAN